ncbi:MAG: HIT domain-containing protein [Microbacteriaceae bacterium]|nr:HIT domain-containing protein [Microbacteriaceae bacterium]MDR9443510.1 HIT domain-containing protein [Microbacteriaceae bacterium]
MDIESSYDLGAQWDGFERLWTPHRLVYIQNGQQPADKDCPFCLAPDKTDEDGLIVRRGTHAFVLMNLFPYNSGHLLICPYRHYPTLDLATKEESDEITQLTQEAMRVLQGISGTHGFNIGLNQGEIAGAGIAGHLHQHIVPRWRNDANFFPIIGQTKALPRLIGSTREELQQRWDEFKDPQG